MSTFDDWKHLFALFYIIPSLALYFAVLYMLFFSSVKNKFSTPFYGIFGFSACNYILHAIVFYLLNRLTAIPALFEFLQELPKTNVCYPILYGMLFYSGFGVHLYGFLISFNRFTIFILKLNYQVFWRRFLKPILAFTVIFPLIFICNFPFMQIENAPIEGKGANIEPKLEIPEWWNRSRNLVIEIYITSFLSLIMNVFVIYSIIKWRYYTQESDIKITSQDIALTIYSILIFVTEASSGVVQFLFAIDRDRFYAPISKNLWIIADLTSLTPIWFIIITDKLLQKELFYLLFSRNSIIKGSVKVGVVR